LVAVEALGYEALSVVRNVLPLTIWEFQFLELDVLVYFLDVLPIKWCLARQELVGNDSQAPYIYFL